MKYAVAEIFHSIQGQGYWSGTPAVFVRLQGCDVGCPWCNEKQTWERAEATESIGSILESVARHSCSHIVITGGEPFSQDIDPLVTALLDRGYRVQIETSGTEPIKCCPAAWVTVAPKFYMKKPYIVRSGMSEIKVMVGKPVDIVDAGPLIAANPQAHVFLHPISGSKKATKLCVEAAMANNWRVSVQLHTLLGLR